jgi:DNA repair protein RecO (recombination protein O)
MSYKKTEAIVIKSNNLREADKIITFFSKGYGKIQGVARGIRKIRSKYSGKLDLFNRVNVIFFQKLENPQESHPLLRITQVDVVEVFPQLKNDFNRIIGASYIAEFLNRAFEDHDASHPSVYVLVCHALKALATFENMRPVIPAFEIKLLVDLGYAPILDHCTSCQKPKTDFLKQESQAEKPASNTLLGFHSAKGGVLCSRCKRLKKGSIDISAAAIDMLQHLLTTDIMQLESIILSPQLHQEIKSLLTGHIQYHLGIVLKTDTFVQKLRSAHLAK